MADRLRGLGRPLDATVRGFMERGFGQDFSHVRLHADQEAAEMAEARGAQAYTIGPHVSFAAGTLAPGTVAGRELIAHELAHVVQQGAAASKSRGSSNALEAQADQAAAAVMRGGAVPAMSAAAVGVQRRVAMRDVGRGEQSGFARVGEFVDRLNGMSQGLVFANTAGELTYTLRDGGTLSEFDTQMMGFIDDNTVIPMRFANRHALEGTRPTPGDPNSGFRDPIFVDSYMSGNVDIDDLLASSDLGLQTSLVHLLRERAGARNYVRRTGSPSLDAREPGPARVEFLRAHGAGIQAELQILRDFFSDPSIRIVDAGTRLFRNDRRDRIRERDTAGRGAAGRGVTAISWEVVLHDSGRVITAEEYRQLRADERVRDQVERERLGGAIEYREGARGVPAP